jgi:hypothetical protein
LGYMNQPGCLMLYGFNDFWVAMPYVVDGYAGEYVEVFVAFHIPYLCSLPPLKYQRETFESGQIILLVQLD